MKYKNAEYYRQIVTDKHKDGLNYNNLSLYLRQKGIKRFESGLEYTYIWVRDNMEEDVFDPYMFDAIVFLARKKKVKLYIKEKIRPKAGLFKMVVVGSQLQDILNGKK